MPLLAMSSATILSRVCGCGEMRSGYRTSSGGWLVEYASLAMEGGVELLWIRVNSYLSIFNDPKVMEVS